MRASEMWVRGGLVVTTAGYREIADVGVPAARVDARRKEDLRGGSPSRRLPWSGVSQANGRCNERPSREDRRRCDGEMGRPRAASPTSAVGGAARSEARTPPPAARSAPP